MNSFVAQSPTGSNSRMWRWGIGLALLTVLYIVAVVAFIIVY